MAYEIFIDKETGECMDKPICGMQSSRVSEISVNNAETGEPEINIRASCQRRRIPFQIPKNIRNKLSSNKEKKIKKKCSRVMSDIIPLPKGMCFGEMNPIFLFLPAIIYFKWFVVILLAFEVIIHRWAHHKNKKLKNQNVYYRSPLNGITAEFCALCRNEVCMNKVGKMHQIRLHKFLRQCQYIKRVVS